MTEEEMAEEEMAEKSFSAREFEYKLSRDERSYKEGFLAGLKAGRPKWHKVADGDLPQKSISVLAYFKEDVSLVECLYIPDEGFKHPIFSEWYEPTAWIEKEKILPGVFAGLA